MIKIRGIDFVCENKASLVSSEDVDPEALPDGTVLVKTAYSTISCGTERANITGEKNVAGNSDCVPPFPRRSGYSSAGTVVALGKGVTSVKAGDRVVVYWGLHRNYNLVPEKQVVKIPDSVSFADAAISFISAFSLAAIRKTALEIGEACLVMGLGILGQCAVKYARIAGAYPVIAADPKADRRELALKCGADFAFDPIEKDFSEKVKKATGGGANVCIEVTGVGAGLDGALDCMAKFGRIALLGCTRNSDFSIDYYKKVHCQGVTLIGAHTNARPQNESYPHHFTHNDDIKVALNLIKGGRLTFSAMIGETHSPEECKEVYERLVNDKNFPVCVQFDWSRL
ncbi:MAG: zinc-binding alcohol dehydrogenase [Clostridia bacterium]|nr:zinc-binding alcohol dehydrogenase [Clostridia bacterium]